MFIHKLFVEVVVRLRVASKGTWTMTCLFFLWFYAIVGGGFLLSLMASTEASWGWLVYVASVDLSSTVVLTAVLLLFVDGTKVEFLREFHTMPPTRDESEQRLRKVRQNVYDTIMPIVLQLEELFHRENELQACLRNSSCVEEMKRHESELRQIRRTVRVKKTEFWYYQNLAQAYDEAAPFENIGGYIARLHAIGGNLVPELNPKAR